MSSYTERERAAIRVALPDAPLSDVAPGHRPTNPAASTQRVLLVVLALLAVATAWLAAPLAPPHTAEPDLARLLSAMGWIKGGIVAAAGSILFVRFRWPTSTGVAAGYVLVVSVGAFAATMIAKLAYVGPAALLFHAAALAAIVLAALEGRRAKIKLPKGSARDAVPSPDAR